MASATRTDVERRERQRAIMRNLVRSLLSIALTAGAAWLANYIVERIFGPEDDEIAPRAS
jgi:hypothetical protein